MATTDRDYYELLGVGRESSEAEIKRAFRQLAREFHPDVSDAPDAQERFREVVEAYEVLSNTETRNLYDRYGHAGLRSGGFQAGRVVEERTLPVEIPPGIHHGQQIRLTGAGHAGLVGGRAGDVYVEVRIRPDERFVREGDDIYATVDLTFTQAALGATLTVPTLDGEEELELPPGTQPGEIVVLHGRGMPVLQRRGRGDQRILVNVLVPRHLDDEQRRLLREFDERADGRTYGKSEGLFDKLKSAFR